MAALRIVVEGFSNIVSPLRRRVAELERGANHRSASRQRARRNAGPLGQVGRLLRGRGTREEPFELEDVMEQPRPGPVRAPGGLIEIFDSEDDDERLERGLPPS